MIKRQLFWWVILAILVMVGLTFLGDQYGHVMIVRTPYRVQLSFNFLLVLLVVSFILFYYLMRVLGVIKRMPSNWKTKQNIKQLNAQQSLLVKSIAAMADGETEQAQKLLAKANKKAENEELQSVLTTLTAQNETVKQLEQKIE